MVIEKNLICPLCHSRGNKFYNNQFQECSGCKSIFRCADYFISQEKEKLRYEHHKNDVKDKKYQEFVSPIVHEITENHSPNEDGLDFGAGTGPVISYLLGKKGFTPKLYDPFFHNYPNLLGEKYDYIIACEVVEHFFHPKKEFELLHSLLKPKGKLYIMTNKYSPEIDFKSWYYKNDVTHVFFYSTEAFNWIEKNWPWKNYSKNEKCIVFEKN